MSPLTKYETLERDEEKKTKRMIEVMRSDSEKTYPPGSTPRNVHARHTALVEGTFTVEPNLPPELRLGVFAEPRTFHAWIRFSNASGVPTRSDAIKDLRGASIKLCDVSGTHIPESDETTTQDFTLVQTPAMSLGTVSLFHDAITLISKYGQIAFIAKMVLTFNFRALKAVKKAEICPPSPADIAYFSTTPYLFGPDRVVKYSLRPTSPFKGRMPPNPLGTTYLTASLNEHLAQGDATFDFLIQFRTDPDSMPVDDASYAWSEEESPFVKVGSVCIPQQAFDTPERNKLAEALAFGPHHALVEHRPIGSLNRARMQIYREQALWRQARDKRTRVSQWPAPAE